MKTFPYKFLIAYSLISLPALLEAEESDYYDYAALLVALDIVGDVDALQEKESEDEEMVELALQDYEEEILLNSQKSVAGSGGNGLASASIAVATSADSQKSHFPEPVEIRFAPNVRKISEAPSTDASISSQTNHFAASVPVNVAGTLAAVKIVASAAIKNYADFSSINRVGENLSTDASGLSLATTSYVLYSTAATGGALFIAAIPEPSLFGIFASFSSLALAGTRRRKK